jgi:AAA family ATP:ADP antiporter
MEKSVYVGKFYSGFYTIVNLAGVILQFFVVSRLIRYAVSTGHLPLPP